MAFYEHFPSNFPHGSSILILHFFYSLIFAVMECSLDSPNLLSCLSSVTRHLSTDEHFFAHMYAFTHSHSLRSSQFGPSAIQREVVEAAVVGGV